MPVTLPLTDAQRDRYARQIALPEIGDAGQERLLAAKAAIVGAGGLGSAAALYLAAAGIGTLGIVDADTVALSNLQRQVLYRVSDVGHPKARSARETIAGLNSDVQVISHDVRLDAANAVEILSAYDVVLSCVDSLTTRYLLNDICVLVGTPLIDGAVYRFEGQAAVYLPRLGCYRCLYPQATTPHAEASAAEAGILGVTAGLVGVIQAAEAIKVILGIGRTLSSRVLLVDLLTMEFRGMQAGRDPACPVCGDQANIGFAKGA
jgi:sulfur-carrier protein adenylyltransferase/sulfurtransferase